ncbi:DinB family protein [Prosthecomicrobium sp. N25]|uniref:DinB family protein n=1 Tax=Prosthecomicrobium sp. N25 TaxID=3129254 RepID=UPI0030768E1A
MPSTIRMFARYNQWANRRLYEAAARLTPAEYRADHGAFFRSLKGTLNHILVGDRVWMSRFTGTGPVPSRLDEILFEDFAALRAAREAEDARIVAWADGLDEAALAGRFTYRPLTRPEPITQPLWHFFNHQTHHRGQAHVILTRTTGEGPELDLILYQRETGDGL